MWLDLREIIEIPGAGVDFECELDGAALSFPSVKCFKSNPRAHGRVANSAGLLTLKGELFSEMVCVCDRCGKEFDSEKVTELDLSIAGDAEDSDDPGVFPLDGDGIDLSALLETSLILDMETKFLCSEDCRGLCPTCGKDLNDGPCGCQKPIDPRLAVLGQLLDIDEK